jgi:hypothetical protein
MVYWDKNPLEFITLNVVKLSPHFPGFHYIELLKLLKNNLDNNAFY